MSDRKVRVRFAPSPTGALHIGGVRTALYNYLFARQHGGDLIFRIEDTDSSRFVPGAEEYIIESFKWLGIKFDEGVSFGGEHGPYRQSERRDIYKKYVDVLMQAGKAYIAFDTPEELDAKRAEVQNFQYDASTRMGMRNSLSLPEEEVKAMIERQKKKYGWEFLFLGANIDAIETARSYGIDQDRAVEYNCDSVGTGLNFEAMSDAITTMRCSAPLTADWKKKVEADRKKRKTK